MERIDRVRRETGNGMKAKRFGKLPPRYRFFLNPYSDLRFTKCPICGNTTKQRKVPLVIHVEPRSMLSIHKTCRYCPTCDLLIAHQDEVEAQLVVFFTQHDPARIGNAYLGLGTQERTAWRQGMKTAQAFQEMLESLHDFKEVLKFELTYE